MAVALQSDSKGRLNLGKKFASCTFLLKELDDGEYMLTKAAIIPEKELWLLKDPKALKDIQSGLNDARGGRLHKVDPTEFED